MVELRDLKPTLPSTHRTKSWPLGRHYDRRWRLALLHRQRNISGRCGTWLAVLFLVLHQFEFAVARGPKLYNDLPARVSYYMDDGIRLHCSTATDPMPNPLSFTWFRVLDKGSRRELSDSDDLFTFHQNRRVMRILPHSSERERNKLKLIKGSYYCEAENDDGHTRSRKCVVNPVSSAITIGISQDNPTIFQGGTTVLTCKIQPEYAHSFYRLLRWEMYDEQRQFIRNITSSDEKYSILRSIYPSELHIRRTDASDAAKFYKCVVESTIRLTDRSRRSQMVSPFMTVTLTPSAGIMATYMQLSHRSLRINAKQGTSVEMPCIFHVSSVVTYMWYHNKEKIYPLNAMGQKKWGKKYQIVAKGHGNLRITNLEWNDSGIYSCEGRLASSGSITQTRGTILLNVSAPLGVTLGPRSLSVDFKQRAVLHCTVHGYPYSRIYWLHNSKPLRVSDNVATITENSTSRVEIKAADRLNAGVYQCFTESGSAIDPLDNAQASIMLNVLKVPPELHWQYPPADKQDGYAHTVLGLMTSPNLNKQVQLVCEFVGSEPLYITWFLDDQRIPLNGNVITMVDKRYKLSVDMKQAYKSGGGDPRKSVLFGGEYKAVASSDYGSAECRAFVEIDTKLTIRKFRSLQPIEGKDFELKCYVLGRNSVKGVTIEWTKEKNGEKHSLPNNHRHSVTERGRSLVIKNVKKDDDDGTYKCTAKDKDGQKTEQRVTLDVRRLPVINNFVNKYHLDEGQDKVTVTCNIKNQADEPWFAWWVFKDANVPSRKALVLSDSSKLAGVRITQAQPQRASSQRVTGVPPSVKPNTWVMLEIARPKRNMHAGNYTCYIQNKVGKSNATAQVTFKPKIKFDKKPPPTQTVVLNNNLIIKCSAKGAKPKPIVEWKYLNKSRGDTYASIKLLERLTKGRISQDAYGTLRVFKVRKSDPTHFMCYVSMNSSAAEAISQVVKITVCYPAEIQPMKNQECKEGAPLNLTCVIEGDATIESDWEYFDTVIKDWTAVHACRMDTTCDTYPKIRRLRSKKGPRILIDQLRFPSVVMAQQTKYRCKAKNKFNSRHAVRETTVTVISAPEQPREVKVEEVKARSVTFCWQRPRNDGNKPITHYTITYFPMHRGHTPDRRAPKTNLNVSVEEGFQGGEAFRYKIEDLRPSVEYRLQVVAVNDVGVSQAAASTQRTNEAKPEAKVQNLAANGTNSDTIRVSWSPPPDDKLNGMLTKYSVCLLQAGATSTDIEKVPTNDKVWSLSNKMVRCESVPADGLGEVRSKEFTGLPKFTKYYVRVYASNQMGSSPPAFTYARTLEDVPQRPPIGVICTAGTSSVQLEWNPPNQDDMNGILTGYTIRYFETNEFDDESSAKVINISSTTKTTVHQLQHYTNYTFRIYAVNSKGSGPPSKPALCLTYPSEPEPPAEVKLLAVNSTCLVASWRHPRQSNGRLTEYVLFFEDISMRDIRQYKVIANTRAYFNVKYFCDLRPSTDYALRIKAKNHAPKLSMTTDEIIAETNSNAPARFLGFNRTIVINNNMNLNLSCEAVGGRELDLRVTKVPGQITKNQVAHDFKNDPFFRLRNVQPSFQGSYECRAKNLDEPLPVPDVILYNVEVRVIKRTPPMTPKLMHGRQRLHSVEVEWRPLGSAQSRRKDTPINRYWITYANHFTGVRRTVSVSANNRTFFLSNLTCGTVINFWIKAENKIGNSSLSSALKMRTRGSSPVPSGLDNIVPPRYQDQAYFNLTSAFRPGDGCPPLKYHIRMIPAEIKDMSFDPSQFLKDYKVSYDQLEHQCCFNITGLHRGSDYSYIIKAENAAGAENQTGKFNTPSQRNVGPGPSIRIKNPKAQLSVWQRPAIVVMVVLALIVVIIIGVAILLFVKRRQMADELREQRKGPVNTCVNDLKGLDRGKTTEGLPHFGAPFNMPHSEIHARAADDDERLSNDGSIDSEGNINPYATFTNYETATIDRHELPDDSIRELGAVAAESGRMRERIRPVQKRKRAPLYEHQGPKPYENDSVSGTLSASKRRANSLDRLDELDAATAATYNRGYATGGGAQIGRSFYEPKYPGDHHYRGGSVLSSTTMSSNHDELTQAYEYGRRARYESALNTTDGFNVDENLDLHTGSGSSETTDPGIRKFTQQPPMPDEQRQATCEVPLFKTPIIDRRKPSYNPSETYEPMDEGYCRQNELARHVQHPARQAPLPAPPGARSNTLGRHLVGATAASTRAAIGGYPYRSRADSESTYGGHVYDSTDPYYSGTNFSRRVPHPAPSGVEYPRHGQSRVPAGRYYNGGAGGPSERHPLVPGGPGSGSGPSVVRPLAYGGHGVDPDEAQSLLVGRRYSVQRGASGTGTASSAGSGGSGGPSGAAAALPGGLRRPSRPNVPVGAGNDAVGVAPLLIPVAGEADDDSETENIYTSEFTVV